MLPTLFYDHCLNLAWRIIHGTPKPNSHKIALLGLETFRPGSAPNLRRTATLTMTKPKRKIGSPVQDLHLELDFLLPSSLALWGDVLPFG